MHNRCRGAVERVLYFTVVQPLPRARVNCVDQDTSSQPSTHAFATTEPMLGVSYFELLLIVGLGSVVLGILASLLDFGHNACCIRPQQSHLRLQGLRTSPEWQDMLGKPLAEQQHISQWPEANLPGFQRRHNWTR